METVIKTVNLTKRYGSLVALSNLNLEIQEGDCYGYIGPNGAGKSTTIKVLATLLQPTWGEARGTWAPQTGSSRASARTPSGSASNLALQRGLQKP